MRCPVRIAFVLEQFASMGMTAEEAARERARLLTDDAYYDAWCERLHEWCASVPEEFAVRHAVDLSLYDDYPTYGGRPSGVQCPRCGKVSGGTGMDPEWHDPGPTSAVRDPAAACWSAARP